MDKLHELREDLWSWNIKITLQIVISVVWLTNFLVDIQNLINPRWWVEELLLSGKRCENSCKDVWHIDEWTICLHSINYSFRTILSRENFKSQKEDKSVNLHNLQPYASSWQCNGMCQILKFRRIDIWRSYVAYHISKYIHTIILYPDMQK